MTADWSHLARARSLLFVPGNRPDRFAKAAGSGADGIVLDIEDAVAPALKSDARDNIGRWLANGGTGVVRINDQSTPWYDDDVAMLAPWPCAVMLPKVTAPDQVQEVLGRLAPGSCVLPLIETAAAALEARVICSVPGVARAVFGNADLGRELGVGVHGRLLDGVHGLRRAIEPVSLALGHVPLASFVRVVHGGPGHVPNRYSTPCANTKSSSQTSATMNDTKTSTTIV